MSEPRAVVVLRQLLVSPEVQALALDSDVDSAKLVTLFKERLAAASPRPKRRR